MSDIVIKGIELPKEGKISISITANGNAYLGIEPAYSQKKFETVVLPEPHGRLIDENDLHIKDTDGLLEAGTVWDAPTIIEASEVKE